MKWNQSPRSLDGEIDSVLFCKWCFGFWVGKRYNFSHWKNYCKNSSLWKGETFHFFLCQKEKSFKKEVGNLLWRKRQRAVRRAVEYGSPIDQSPSNSAKTRHEWHSFLVESSDGIRTFERFFVVIRCVWKPCASRGVHRRDYKYSRRLI